MCSLYIPYCTNIDLSGKCIACCFGSSLINGICKRDQRIRNCDTQSDNTCLKCMNGTRYCEFC